MKSFSLAITCGALFTLFFLLGTTRLQGQQPIDCNGDLFLTHAADADDPTAIIQFNPDRLNWDTLAMADVHIAPIGYRIIDQVLYGLDQDNWNLMRMDGDGQVSVVADLSSSIDTTYDFFAGDVSPTGRYLTLIGRDRTPGLDRELFFILLCNGSDHVGRVRVVNADGFPIAAMGLDPQ
ncbi:MAG: hypothetical protein AAF206_16950, partial [Bacteroidota bacterium]